MASMSGYGEHSMLGEFEDELEDESVHEGEEEWGDILGAAAKGIGGMLGLGEYEDELEATGLHEGVSHEGGIHEGTSHEFEVPGLHEGTLHEGMTHESALHEFEDESVHEGEEEWGDILGAAAKGIGGMLGLGEYEDELEATGLHEGVSHEGGLHEYEYELEGEQFFGRAFRGIGRFVRRAAPLLRNVAKIAAPMVGTAMLGPLGGVLGRVASSALESELEAEMEDEAAGESEAELEMEAAGPIPHHEALAQYMAAVASQAYTEAEAEAMAGAATITVLSPADRAALSRIIPQLVRASATLTRILRSRRTTRPIVRAVPTIVRRTAKTLTRRAAAGRPVTKPVAARVMAAQTRRVLARPNACAAALQRNVRATRAVSRAVSRRVGPPARSTARRRYPAVAG